ncbi:hypothetical protein FA10DRAFT_283420 [Acaromyces ingoldii]|uniref:Homeobox domain-containing protein n=1 Tax=Acaromyces ingoldii TaxID=215250 RepID=A0A316YXM2_9BASI|nr:hypothetical protein FA10DRAFT_283420 [Acaromyces ingoldii]PWN93796.1 hypothetical protein FA10DRAFT_283420 [Acaromyces ingoldii]
MLLSRQTSQVLSPDGRLPYLPAIRPGPHNSIKAVDSAVDVDRNGLRHTIKHDEGMLQVRQGGNDGCESHVYLHAGQQQQRQNHPSHLDQVQTHIEQHFVTPMHRPPNVRSPRPPSGPAIALEDQFPFLKDGRKRTRKLLTPEQTRFLESILEKTAYPSTVTRNAVASILNVSPRKVQVWFQNKRQGHRRQTNACNGQKSFRDPSDRVDGILQRGPRSIDDHSTCHDAALTASSLPGLNKSGVAPQSQRMTHTFWDDRFSDQGRHRQQQQYMASQSMKFDSVDHSRRLYGVESSPPSHTISRTRFDVSSASSSSSSSPPSPSYQVEHDKEPSFARQEQLPATTLEANILPPILDSRLASRAPSPSTVFKTGQISASTITTTQNSSPSKSPLTLPSVAELLALR